MIVPREHFNFRMDFQKYPVIKLNIGFHMLYLDTVQSEEQLLRTIADLIVAVVKEDLLN
jgi:hypothetical protein